MSRWFFSFTGYLGAALAVTLFAKVASVRLVLGFVAVALFLIFSSAMLQRLRNRRGSFFDDLNWSVMQLGVEILVSGLIIFLVEGVFGGVLGANLSLAVIGSWVLGLVSARTVIETGLRGISRFALFWGLFWAPPLFLLHGELRGFVAAMLVASFAGVLSPWLLELPYWRKLDLKISRLLQKERKGELKHDGAPNVLGG